MSMLCSVCEKVKTYSNEGICTSCCNKQYSNDMSNGMRVELKIYMKYCRHSTLMRIKEELLDEKKYMLKKLKEELE